MKPTPYITRKLPPILHNVDALPDLSGAKNSIFKPLRDNFFSFSMGFSIALDIPKNITLPSVVTRTYDVVISAIGLFQTAAIEERTPAIKPK